MSKILAAGTKENGSKLSPEDAFFENLTLGLMKTLSNVPRITNVVMEKRPPCEKVMLSNWEQRHNVYLPEDMKKFYLSCDGFHLHWSYQYAPNDIRRVGSINCPHLLQITLLRENVDVLNSTNSETNKNLQNINTTPGLIVTPKTKIFELNMVTDLAKICLVYESTGLGCAKIFLLELNSYKWQFLAETFSEYIRMAIAHLGLPYWELCFSSVGLPSWTEQLYLLLAPHLIEENEPRRGRAIQPISEQPYQTLDPNIFKNKPKCTKILPKVK
ncbi:tubulin polyglutamylase complex subunit 2 [Condylostylus longicornis]|uniref:tubulin polyglutamylase complex subunit 2 n=1 Tax=Condylostylus longicornis TaxID=2530218 RepID=UPI00244E593F|nr:tubulin polyglutamylase complex subunit 2 [Condylostylus longicornis]